jgi:hypothetical protein
MMDIKSFNERQKHDIYLLELVIDALQQNPVWSGFDIRDVIDMRDRMIVTYGNYKQLLAVE